MSDTEKSPIILDMLKVLTENKSAISQSFITTMLTLSGGALGLSLTFVKDIITDTNVTNNKIFLVIAWGCFAISLTLTLIILGLSYESYEQEIQILNLMYEAVKNSKDIEKKNKISPWVFGFTWLSVFAFVIGVVFLIIFCAMNF